MYETSTDYVCIVCIKTHPPKHGQSQIITQSSNMPYARHAISITIARWRVQPLRNQCNATSIYNKVWSSAGTLNLMRHLKRSQH
jgi:hypothetical protein